MNLGLGRRTDGGGGCTCAAAAWKQRSLERFVRLPEDKEKITKTAKSANGGFRALAPAEAKRMNLGAYQQGRADSLEAAAAAGDHTRLAWLLEAGVDVDAVNNYGQSAVLLAAAGGHAAAVTLLVTYAAADARRAANGGITPWRAAASQRHLAVLDALRAAGVPEDEHAHLPHLPPPRPPSTSPPPPLPTRRVTMLIPTESDHVGAGSFYVDGGFDDAFLERVREERSARCRPCARTAPTRRNLRAKLLPRFCDSVVEPSSLSSHPSSDGEGRRVRIDGGVDRSCKRCGGRCRWPPPPSPRAQTAVTSATRRGGCAPVCNAASRGCM